MKASELIKELEKAIAEHGDLPVVYQCKHWWLAEVERLQKTESVDQEQKPVIQIV